MSNKTIIILVSVVGVLAAGIFGYFRMSNQPVEVVQVMPPSQNVAFAPDIELVPQFELPERTVQERAIQNKFIALRNQIGNDDIVGHIRIDGTTIDYPVVQGDDNSFYLYRDINRNMNVAGSIFLDYENDLLRYDRNTIIYGHNMNRNHKFHAIRFFYDRDFLERHRFITFDTIYGNQTFEIFAFYDTHISFDYIRVHFANDDDFMRLVNEMKRRCIHNLGVEVGPNDRILTLSTCTNVHMDTRLVINAKLVSYTPYIPVTNNSDIQELRSMLD